MWFFPNKLARRFGLAAVLLIQGCVSTSLDNNLGTQVSSQNGGLSLSWQADHPFAADYQRNPITVIAEYVEVNLDGQTKRVRQQVSQRNRSYRQQQQPQNQRQFQLINRLRSLPSKSHPICLYFETNRTLIPIRDQQQGDTARFRFPQWENAVINNTYKQVADQNLAVARNQVNTLQRQLDTLKSKSSENQLEFNQQLSAEPLVQPMTVSQKSQCDTIQLATNSETKPRDVVPQNLIKPTAEKVCTMRAYNGLNYDKYTVRSLIHAAIATTDDALAFKLSQLPAERRGDFQAFMSIFFTHYKEVEPGSPYQPELGKRDDYIEVSAHAAKMQPTARQYLKSTAPLSEEQIAVINQVLAAELAVFNSCISEGQQQLRTKRDAWDKREKALPERTKAREAFLQQKCRSFFTNTESALAGTTSALDEAERELARLESLYQSTPTPEQTAAPQALNQLQCSL